jgi:hypothetical protein
LVICLQSEHWPEPRDALIALLLAEVPRLAVSADQIWIDARGLNAEQ